MNRKIIKQYNDSVRKMRFFYYYSYFEACLQGRNEVRLLNRAADARSSTLCILGDVILFPPSSFAWGIRLPGFIIANRPCLFLSGAVYWSAELITEAAQLDGQVVFPRLAKGAVVFGSGMRWFSSVGQKLGLEDGVR